MIDEVCSVFLISMYQSLGIGIVLKLIALFHQFLSKLLIVVYLPVKHNRHILRLIGHRLGTVVKINDTQSSKAKIDAIIYILSIRIRSPVNNLIHHISQHVFVSVIFLPCKTTNSTHSTCHPFSFLAIHQSSLHLQTLV